MDAERASGGVVGVRDLDTVALVGADHERLNRVVAKPRRDLARCFLGAHGGDAARENVHLADRVVVAEAIERDPDVDRLDVEMPQRGGGGAGPQGAGRGAAAERDGGKTDERQSHRGAGGGEAARERTPLPLQCTTAPLLHLHEDDRGGQGDREGEHAVPKEVGGGRELRARVMHVAAEEPGVHGAPGGEHRGGGDADQRRRRGRAQARSDIGGRAQPLGEGERSGGREQDRRHGDRHGTQDLQQDAGLVAGVSTLEHLEHDHPGADRERKRQCERERANESPEDSAFSAVTLDAPLVPQHESTHCFVPSLFFGTTMPVPWAWSKPLVPGGALPTWIRWTRTTRLPSRTRRM